MALLGKTIEQVGELMLSVGISVAELKCRLHAGQADEPRVEIVQILCIKIAVLRAIILSWTRCIIPVYVAVTSLVVHTSLRGRGRVVIAFPFEALDQRKLAWLHSNDWDEEKRMTHPFVLLLLEAEVVRADCVLVKELGDVSVNGLGALSSQPFEALDQRKLAWLHSNDRTTATVLDELALVNLE
ncbi:hypothetical protein AURDEDRAFT_176917 [Auricularia subglabra TFB-10046 SS5]|uniref:Uncharacterized protein n=1 Tax=Auricularia subglabra (strain TFB-10046 / SS5) TaxID=717982 RepID=J0WQ78_AURST|nr:hypothetical protein AURDEDRAFT_176917 [Auricularia subglabra TFB-10046 SS5]